MVLLSASLLDTDQDQEIKHKPTKSSPINSLLLKVVKAQQSATQEEDVVVGHHGSAQTQKRLSTFTGSQKTKSDASNLPHATVI